MLKRITVLVSLLAFLASGCSFALMQTPASKPGDQMAMEPRCTHSVAAPVIDTLFTVGGAGNIISGTILTANTPKGDVAGPALLVSSIASAALFGASAGVGYSQAAQCQEVRQEYQAQEIERRAQERREVAEKKQNEKAREAETTSEQKKALDIFEAADACYVEPKVIRHALGHNKLSATRTENGYRIPREELEEFCRNHHENK